MIANDVPRYRSVSRLTGVVSALIVLCGAWLCGPRVGFWGHASLAAGTNKRAPWPQPAAGPSASGAPEVLFTFDDGPHEQFTPKILDILKKRGVRVVFFWSGWRVNKDRTMGRARREIARRALAEGHLIGNHTINHAHLCAVKKPDATREIDEGARIWGELAGMPITWMRAPYGDRCKRLDQMLADRGLSHLHWDMDPMEWKTWSTEETVTYLTKRIRRLEGRAVILMHDTHPQGVGSLPRVLDFIAQENVRRRARGQREIRILSYADLERERLAPGVDDAVGAVGQAALDFAPDVVADLLLPLAPRAALAAKL